MSHRTASSRAPAAAGAAAPARIPLGLLFLMGSLAAIGPFSIDTYLPAMPEIARQMGTSADRVQSTLAAYFVGLALGQLVVGPLADRFGRRPPLLVGLAVYVAASVGCSLAPSVEALMVLRALQAFGACAGLVASRAVLRDLYPPRDMARALSLIMLVMGIAPIVAPMVGSALFARFGWPAIFVALAVYGGLTLAATAAFLPETLRGPRAPLRPTAVVGRFAGILADPVFLTWALAGGIAQAAMFVYISSSSFVFIEVHGLAPDRFALLFGANAVGLIAASQVNERLLRRWTAEQVFTVVIGVFALATGLVLAAALTGLGGTWGLALPLGLAIACLGFCFPNSTAAAMGPVGDRAGAAAAVLGTLQYGLAGLAAFVSGQLFDGTARSMAALMFGCAVVAGLVLVLGRRTAPAAPTAAVSPPRRG